MKITKKILKLHEAQEVMQALGNEFAIVWNPDFVHPQFELYPLPENNYGPLEFIEAVVMDMDGTTTTTEELCLHSLEYMVRRISGKFKKEEWSGLDKLLDYPHIIGNSTTKHVEYLITRYNNYIDKTLIKKEFIKAAIWTLLIGKDNSRKNDIKINLSAFNISNLLEDNKFQNLIENINSELFEKSVDELALEYSNKFELNLFQDYVRVAVDIYYQRYHEILYKISKGETEELEKQFLSSADKHLIEPMPGIEVYLSLVKGFLDEADANYLVDYLIKQFELKNPNYKLNYDKAVLESNLKKMIKYFNNNPAKVGIVTSSIRYEAEIVLNELFNVIRKIIKSMELSEKVKSKLIEKFRNIYNIYDTFVTASDSNEIRLKPHRDLYSIALGNLNISKSNFSNVIGFEDSQSGTTAIRAAGIGLSVALPFHATENHNFEAATYKIKDGIPEVILNYNTFLKV